MDDQVGGRGGLPHKKRMGCLFYLLEVKKVVWYLLCTYQCQAACGGEAGHRRGI